MDLPNEAIDALVKFAYTGDISYTENYLEMLGKFGLQCLYNQHTYNLQKPLYQYVLVSCIRNYYYNISIIEKLYLTFYIRLLVDGY